MKYDYNRKSHEVFVSEIKNIFPEIEVISEYVNRERNIIVMDLNGIFYHTTPNSLLCGHYPSICNAINKTDAFKIKLAEKRTNVTLIGRYINSTSSVIVEDKDNIKYKVSVNRLLNGTPITILCAINKSDVFKRNAVLVHGDKYNYNLVEYKTAKKDVKIICKQHGIFYQTPDNHLHGEGCYECGMLMIKQKAKENVHKTIDFSKTKWVTFCNKKQAEASIYVLRCVGNGECFVKIGITYMGIKNRFTRDPIPYDYTVMYLYTDSPEFIYDKEKELHREFKDYKYHPVKSFGGHTECFNISVLDEIKKIHLFKIAI